MKSVLVAIALALLAGCAASERPWPHDGGIRITVLSSEPQFVSGGDALVAVEAPARVRDRLAYLLNGRSIHPPMKVSGGRLEGLVTGLADGKNVLEVRAGERKLGEIAIVNHPLTGPMFTGPQQQPFICRTQESSLGQPLVDNHDGIGHPVFDASRQLVGWSRYCSIPVTYRYFYFNGSAFPSFDPATGFKNPPADMKTATVHGVQVPFVVRVEIGTINRFVYTLAMLAPFPEPAGAAAHLDNAAWNRKLVYWMRGGVGIGHQQGLAMWVNNNLNTSERQLMPELLGRGYAVASSTGNETGVHYNARLAEETAMMTKEHFIEAYGKPRYTIGLGGSGGAIQQYLFAQNRPGLLDGGVPIESFPDMVTQITPVSDCPLLEQYFTDEVARDGASMWARWSNRRLIEGMDASDTVRNPVTGRPGSTTCINGWFGEVPTVLNPLYKDPRYDEAARAYGYPPDVFAHMTWTHWNDLANIYSEDSRGYSPDSVDNVGVQYGLAALANGQIGAAEFLKINACVGGWKDQHDFVQWAGAADPFDARNMMRNPGCRDPSGMPAPRREGSIDAMRRAYQSGHVFTGRRLGIPMIDLRPYLDTALNMHDSRQSFAVRARLLDEHPRLAQEQVIWFTGSENDLRDRAVEALSALDTMLGTGTRPEAFTDRCFDADGVLVAAGPGVWDGILDRKPAGSCTRLYPIHSSPRIVAGESLKGDVFKCALQPVDKALRDGTYPAGAFTRQEIEWLKRIFPHGVCDYSKPDRGRRARIGDPARWTAR